MSQHYEGTTCITTFTSALGVIKTIKTTFKHSQCLESGHTSVDHPTKLDLELIRKHIPHTTGQHLQGDKKYHGCNGHCEDCAPNFICLNCGYAECWGCAEAFGEALEDLYPEWDGHGISTYCRGCGSHGDTIVEIFDQVWLMKQLGVNK